METRKLYYEDPFQKGFATTVYCSTEVQKSMLDQKAVTDVLSEVTSRAVGREIRVRFLVGERPGAKKRDKMQDLLRMGSKFDNFTVK